VLQKVKVNLQGLGSIVNWDVYHDGTLFRFCRARNFQLDQAWKMIEADVKWRKENDVDAILDTFPKSKYFKQFLEYWPGRIHGKDKEGFSAYFEKLGSVDAKSFMYTFPEKEVVRFHIFLVEAGIQSYERTCIEHGLPENGGETFIEDLNGLGWSHMYKPGINLVKLCSSIDEAHYPELLKKMIVINAPRIFTLFWAILKPIMDKRTIEKIEILGCDYRSVVEKHVDKAFIPKYLGGGCTQDHECIPPGGVIGNGKQV